LVGGFLDPRNHQVTDHLLNYNNHLFLEDLLIDAKGSEFIEGKIFLLRYLLNNILIPLQL
jgi:hypothetical protein